MGLSVVLYGCETWPIELRKEIRLTKLSSRVALMIILLVESKGYKILGGKREFLSGGIHTFCSSPNSIRLLKSLREISKICSMDKIYAKFLQNSGN
jgi:hypothetical protein